MDPAPATREQSLKWVRNAADERAIDAGCVFDEARGQFVVDWCAEYLTLYEGEHAGEPLVLSDWQYEATMRLFGWVRWSDKYKRWIRRFKTASIWVPKKNKKSPTLAGWGLYLLAGDGEQGQKVYFGAKNGQQAAEISGKHAIEMVRSSPFLDDQCKINLTLKQIEHIETRSILKPISSGDERTQKSKEGLNGSVLIDETHVVDRDFMSRISRAGISRSESLQIEVSTAGDDPESYGKSRWDYGEAVNAGLSDDMFHLHISYHAPQNVSDADLAADPIKYGKMANPAWGHTIDPEEFLADYRRSTASSTALAQFKMYRLNIWQGSSQPWLKMHDWAECATKEAFHDLLTSLEGKECYGALDLSKTTDSTSFVLCFPPETYEGDYIFLTWFWIPEETAKEYADRVSWLDWGKNGHITITEGNTVDYKVVRESIVELRDQYDIRKIFFDPYNSSHLMQLIQDEDGIECESVPQTMANLAEPTKDFERLLLDRRIVHPNNPCMNWQISVAAVKSDGNGNYRIQKPKTGGYQKVDGPQAAVMSLIGGLSNEGGSYYDNNDVEVY
jgi:phage terminase large subunit-like protein